MAEGLKRVLRTRLLLHRRIGPLDVRLLWEPRDMWWGVLWRTDGGFILVYVCLVPLLSLRFAWRTQTWGGWAGGGGG